VRTRLIGLTAALAAVAVTAGCGLTGTEPSEPSKKSGSITVGDKSRQTQSVKCTQTEWALTIWSNANPGRAQVSLKLGGEKPIVETVAIENIDGLYGVSGGDVGKAEATISGSIYTITGTATVTDSAHPVQTQDLPFKIEAPC
jgi:ipoprotein LpqH